MLCYPIPSQAHIAYMHGTRKGTACRACYSLPVQPLKYSTCRSTASNSRPFRRTRELNPPRAHIPPLLLIDPSSEARERYLDRGFTGTIGNLGNVFALTGVRMLRKKRFSSRSFSPNQLVRPERGETCPRNTTPSERHLFKERVDFQPDRSCDDIPPAGPAAVASLGACISPPKRCGKLVLITTITNGYAFPLKLPTYATRALFLSLLSLYWVRQRRIPFAWQR